MTKYVILCIIKKVNNDLEEKIVKQIKFADDLSGNRKLCCILSYVLPAVFFLFSTVIAVYYIFWTSQGEFHADCTDTIMWANASYESGSIFDKSFHYACFLPFGINLIMQPLIAIFGLSMTAQHIGMFAFFILFTGFFMLMLREMHIDIRYNLASSAVLIAMTFSSEKSREIFWGHTIYYTLGLLFIFIGLFLYFKLMNLNEKRKSCLEGSRLIKKCSRNYIITLVILCIFILLTATDGISALSIFGLPFIASIFAERFLDSDTKLTDKKSLYAFARMGTFLVMIVFGTLLLSLIQGDMRAGYQESFSKFSPVQNWVQNALVIPEAWLSVFGVQNLKDTKFSETGGIINILYVINAVVIAVVPIIATCFYKKYTNDTKGRMLKIFIWVHWFSTAIILLGFICGLLSSAPWRLVPVIGTAIVTSILFAEWVISSKILTAAVKRMSVAGTVLAILISVINLSYVAKMPSDNYKDNVLFTLASTLENENLTYGYATFWNANSITVISDSKVKVREVTVDDGGITPRFYQSSAKWYKTQEGQKDYFILLSDREYSDLKNASPELVLQAVKDFGIKTSDDEFRVLVFEHNIFQNSYQ